MIGFEPLFNLRMKRINPVYAELYLGGEPIRLAKTWHRFQNGIPTLHVADGERGDYRALRGMDVTVFRAQSDWADRQIDELLNVEPRRVVFAKGNIVAVFEDGDWRTIDCG